MEFATNVTLPALLSSVRLSVPVYQRPYSWEPADFEQLWDDVLAAGLADRSHFGGTLLLKASGLAPSGVDVCHQVIDGQQRIATILLILAQIACNWPKDVIKKWGIRALINTHEGSPRLTLKKEDQMGWEEAMRLRPGMRFAAIQQSIEKKVLDTSDSGLQEAFLKGLWHKLIFVRVQVIEGDQDAQSIFESINTAGKGLQEADLILNHLLMHLDEKVQQGLYRDYWLKIDACFSHESKRDELSEFFRWFLCWRTGIEPRKKSVYLEFKKWFRGIRDTSDSESVLKELLESAAHYRNWRKKADPAPHAELEPCWSGVRWLQPSVTTPLILEICRRLDVRQIGLEEARSVLREMEGYFVRRTVAGRRPRSLKFLYPWVQRCFGSLSSGEIASGLRSVLHQQTGASKLVSDDEFREDLQSGNLYEFDGGRFSKFILTRLENYGEMEGEGQRKEKIKETDYQIEHVMPQGRLLNEWQRDLGDDWSAIQEKWKHRLGNLSLTGVNQDMGNKGFHEKRDMQHGYRESPIRLNRWIAKQTEWTEETMSRRGASLADHVIDLWPLPQRSDVEWTSAARIQEPDREKWPLYLQFKGSQSISLNSWRDLTRSVAGIALRVQPLLRDALPLRLSPNSTRVLLNRSPEYRDGTPWKIHDELEPGIFLFTNLSAKDHYAAVLQLCSKAGIDPDSLVIGLYSPGKSDS